MHFTHHFNPMVPAESKLLLIYEPIIILVKDLEDVVSLVFWQRVYMTLVVAEQSLADQTKLFQVELSISVGELNIVLKISLINNLVVGINCWNKFFLHP